MACSSDGARAGSLPDAPTTGSLLSPCRLPQTAGVRCTIEAKASVPGRKFRQLDQQVAGGARVDEGDPAAAMPGARRLVDQLDPLLAQFGERAVDVLHLEADMEQALAPLGNLGADLRIARNAVQQLDIGLAHRQHRQPDVADPLLVFEL